MNNKNIGVLVLWTVISICIQQCTYPVHSPDSSSKRIFYGRASYYGKKFHGRKTASGEIFNMYALTAAHRTLPFGTVCRVTNQSNKKSVIVRINDRGPFVQGRILDLSYKAADLLDGLNQGILPVKIEIMKWGSKKK
ncbi:septal ring lytic transglycosylase RlpA family protein [bacterium]|nr:septal ring lytic transglycosylase RlpA family protein [bacterium]